MKKKIVTTVAIILTIAIIIFGMHIKYGANQKENKQDAKAEKITLNSLAVSASGEEVSKVDYNKNIDVQKVFSNKRAVYKIKSYEYSEKDIGKIAETLNSKVENKDKSANVATQYDLDDGGYISYYENSGGLTYISNSNTLDETEGIKFDKEKCKKVAEDFIKKSGIINYDELELRNANVGQTVETSEGEQDISYVLYYIKKNPADIEYYGVGPGIKIVIDSKYKIAQFTSVNKEMLKEAGEYQTIDKDEATQRIIAGKDVQIDGVSVDEKSGVSINSVKICLYSDPLGMEQKYFAPYYVMEGKDKNKEKITIIVPAIKDENVVYN
ncbi:hypothetical protein KQI69_00415 [Eubacterium sp. MSJ-13]|uniref:hypothetical protein n=1 Tax=Eubacterium sp. MSJ-13 TaxID=2841513 RepID=UPI001C11E390|nr:hypothetical protein [Eubacterium sp. MSJ-13]MBU5477663.1 hypothetical protein [Eubacterium sp. MSJ-13]